jgi:hypothetical protein
MAQTGFMAGYDDGRVACTDQEVIIRHVTRDREAGLW